ncbi:hypothetical protein A3I27_00915 [Candidatus Giovannonibacteria bacterium RIFCSPLOWO2_02_FULL_43_11b]|nr:MAG: hypothetical protein A2739_00480 [Candidatus Giovannonibacteria bacterium RIFCSPHIGHO2_01_FULL_43_100]OGF66783.1 MAG: hypothetical protein A3B97_02630 [Candidatus Giovannonibacteria bacterium RIFCSPHIGHO2_02_FULL_43_32]OGF79020.1 MAG: hypothetical protein A3A15_00750 [Candidatus Giovannonibacteria bacterium RIFCSPLOWO2_01_FULL_43_60]OGF90366.1 MAG: hypothetical protein A3I27_00915 [Candidatus Giovannonibacteria bacterium RIFCSPLOWO2_02_FULL_43_11b]OGF92639.1 MAG: hypothetical protein A3
MKVLVQFKITLVNDSGKVLEDDVQHDIEEVLEVEATAGLMRIEKDVSHLCLSESVVIGAGKSVSVVVADWLKKLCGLSSYIPYREKRRHEIASIREGLRKVSDEELDQQYVSMGITDSGIAEAYKAEYEDRSRALP